MDGILFLISAPSGAGKTTVCQRLLKANRELTRVVTCTTRNPRKGEIDCVDYHFLSPAQFQTKLAEDAFLENAEVYGNRYGTLRSDVTQMLEAGQDILLSIDVRGAALLRQRAEFEPRIRRALVTVFLSPPSFTELERRLRSRDSDSEEAITRRLAFASREMAASETFDYLVLSDSMEEDLRRMQIIFEAEKLRRSRVRLPDEFLGTPVDHSKHE
ncbi:MAG: Guanylate kinase [Verrucomicrobia subdivision 3 bacterium]|nr:Guanylate kinase [Limisphaerales bacterium]MCS1413473.1 Guanylate kinase [Limisphaerales bacterium]